MVGVTAPADWWREAFAADYAARYAHRDHAEAERLADVLAPLLHAAPGIAIDVGCGAGRHVRALRARGVTVWGLDYSRDLLQGVVGAARADMRAPPFAPGLSAVLFLFTAFGYFDDAGNRACLKAWA